MALVAGTVGGMGVFDHKTGRWYLFVLVNVGMWKIKLILFETFF